MSDGYYVRDAIPRRLGIRDGRTAFGHHISLAVPLGLLPGLSDVLIAAARETAAANGIAQSSATVLLVAHGSAKAPYSADAARNVASQIERANMFKAVETAFLEEEPGFSRALSGSPRPLIVIGFFAGGGNHAENDVRAAVQRLGDPSVHLVEQLGGYVRIIELITASLRET
jgi:sirohydrochlorin ferrochelatase